VERQAQRQCHKEALAKQLLEMEMEDKDDHYNDNDCND
jgi:hypothetical protein